MAQERNRGWRQLGVTFLLVALLFCALWRALGHIAYADGGGKNGYGSRDLALPFVHQVAGGDTYVVGPGSTFAGSHSTFRFVRYVVEGGDHGVYVRQKFGGNKQIAVGFLTKQQSLYTEDLGTPPGDITRYWSTVGERFWFVWGFPDTPSHTRWAGKATVRDSARATDVSVGARIKYGHGSSQG